MKYYYLFILIGITTMATGKGRKCISELNKDQGNQIESLIITSQNEEKAVTNKANGLKANTPYYIGKLYDKVTPMASSNQFVIPVLKHGITSKEVGYWCKATKAISQTEYKKAVILNRLKKLAIG